VNVHVVGAMVGLVAVDVEFDTVPNDGLLLSVDLCPLDGVRGLMLY